MFESEFYWSAEKCCTEKLQKLLTQRGASESAGAFCVSALVDLWEKSEDVARRVALLSDTNLHTALTGDYDEEYEDVSEIKPRAISGLFLAIRHVLIRQPDRATGAAGLFADTIELERRLFGDLLDPNSVSRRWPKDSLDQYIQVRQYRLEEDSLAGVVPSRWPNSCDQAEALYGSFYHNYIFPSDLDAEYELYLRQFCRLTLELAGLCSCYCEAMSAWCGGDTEESIAERDRMVRVILYARALSAFGIRFGYAQWLETLDSRR